MDERCHVGADCCDFLCLLASILGATNLSCCFVKFLGRALGSLLVAFWLPFGCPLGALGTSLGDFGSTLAPKAPRNPPKKFNKKLTECVAPGTQK